MGQTPRFISECPNVENTLPLSVFRAQSPARYCHAEGDKLVLYAGNSACELEFESASSPAQISIHERILAALPRVAVFVLDTSLVLWFHGATSPFGVEIPYPSIALHALKEAHGEPILYLQILSCDLFRCAENPEFSTTIELALRVRTDASHEICSPLLASASSVVQMYEALGACSALHYDSDSETETAAGDGAGAGDFSDFGEGHRWITADSIDTNTQTPQIEMPAKWTNAGVADDLGIADDDENDEDLDGEAGMNVAVEYVTVAGVVRRRASFAEEKQKSRRIS